MLLKAHLRDIGDLNKNSFRILALGVEGFRANVSSAPHADIFTARAISEIGALGAASFKSVGLL